MLSTCKGVAATPGRGGAEPGAGRRSDRHRGAQGGGDKRQGLSVQEWPDGSRYEGDFMDGLKHGRGKYTWRNGEVIERFCCGMVHAKDRKRLYKTEFHFNGVPAFPYFV